MTKGEPEFWKLDDTMNPRSLNNIKYRFRKIKSLRQLRKSKEQINRGGNRVEKLKEISSYRKIPRKWKKK